MSLRIAFSGASGTGKTTLMKWVAAEYGLAICPLGSREVAKEMGFASPYDVDAAGQRVAFQRRLFEVKRAWEADHADTGFVTDRTYFDNLTYTIMHAHQSITDEWLNGFERAQSIYTHIFVTRMEDFVNIGGDESRRSELVYHRLYQLILNGMHQDHCLNDISFSTGSRRMEYLESGNQQVRRSIVAEAIKQ